MAAPSTFTKDLLASVVVFLVALPLCMGISIASGVPPALGLITGIIGGIIVGFLAGSPLQVSGPAAGLAVIVYQLVQQHGIEMLGPVVLAAGAVQLLAGLLKMGQWFRAISPSVIHGMLAGIGVLIFASQFHVMVDDQPRGSGVLNLISIPEAIYKGIFPLDGSTHHQAASIGMLTIVVLVGWNRFRPAPLKMVPGALVAVVAATVAAAVSRLDIQFVSVPNNLWDAANWVALQDFPRLLGPDFLVLVAVFAFVASAETLLCATAVDQMHSGPRTNYDRELAAQGAGNLLCGFMGALPMTGVIVRSSANVQAGAQTRYSAVLHGIWLLAFVAAMPWVLNMIPTASLAAVLVFTGYKLVNVARIRKLATYGRSEVIIYGVTLAGIVATDLLTGVLAGLALSFAKLIYTFSHLRIVVRSDEAAKRTDIDLHGSATFIRLPQLAAALEQAPRGHEIHVHIERLDHIDHACIELLNSAEQQITTGGGKLVVEWHEIQERYQRSKSARGPEPEPSAANGVQLQPAEAAGTKWSVAASRRKQTEEQP